MPLVLRDRVQETTTSTGTGTITLAGATPGFESFSVIGNGNTTYYAIVGGVQWEIGIGTYTSSGTTLSRDTVLSSSNSNNLVNFIAGSKNVFVTYPTSRLVIADGTSIAASNSSILPVASGGTGSATATFSGANITSINASNISSGTLANARTTATDANGASTIVARDASGNFAGNVITHGAGSNTAPSITFTGNTNTGIYSPTANTIAFTEGGVEAMRIDSSGNVGIGTTSPSSYGLEVKKASGTAGMLVASGSNTGSFAISGTDLYVTNSGAGPTQFWTNGSERMRIDSSGMQPGANNTYDLGTTSLRWRNVFTNDLNLSNGIGDYTIVEGEEDLFLYNNKTGKVFKFLLAEVKPEDAPPKAGRE